jgi:hypothetical protein
VIVDLHCERAILPVTLQLAEGGLRVSPTGTVRLESRDGSLREERFPGLFGADAALCSWISTDGLWAIVVGRQGNAIVGVHTRPPQLRLVAELSRPDLTDKYDPGGLQRNQAIVDGEAVVLIHESGALRIGADLEVEWRRDLDLGELRGTKLTATRLTLITDDADLELDLRTGEMTD